MTAKLPPMPPDRYSITGNVTDANWLLLKDVREWGEQIRRETVQACADATQLVGEPLWYGYECPNTFDDGVRAAGRAILALLDPLQSLTDASEKAGLEP